MKILFVDDRSNLHEKWIEPLRGEGWGVIRTHSVQDAEKVFEFHGESLDALVVAEEHVQWAEKWNYPYVVFQKNWKDTQVMSHQNSSPHPAVAFIADDSNLSLLKQAIEESMSRPRATELKATGSTDASVVISFEKYANEGTGEIVSTSLKSKDSAEASVELPDDETHATQIILSAPVEVPQPLEEPQLEVQEAEDQDRTLVLDPTTLANLDLSAHPVEHDDSEQAEEGSDQEINLDFELSMGSETQQKTEDQPSPSHSGPEHKDLETMRNYLALREQDVAVLTGQFRTALERVQNLEVQLKLEKARNAELQHLNQKQEQKLQGFDRDKQVEFEVLYQQVEDLNLQLRERTDKARSIEAKLKLATEEVDKVKERVRVDIRRIRVREKELESQLEILKKDSTALLVARDEKIVELKRRIDLLEFNMELIQEQYHKERSVTEQLRHKLKEASNAMKRAGGLLDHEN